MPDAERKLEQLKQTLNALADGGRFAVAFSGGLDSRFLAHAARAAGLRPLLLHARGPHVAAGESRFAQRWAEQNTMDFRPVDVDPLSVPEVAANGPMRCYYCKRALFLKLLDEADGPALCDGTHAGDAKAYRPGRKALLELGIRSPLAEAGIDKPEIRVLAERTGMDLPDQKARPCLLTRFAYHLSPDRHSLAALDKAEEKIETLLLGIAGDGRERDTPDFRLRRTSRDGLELHLTRPDRLPETSEVLPRALRAALEEAVREAAGMSLSAIRITDRLSGFFDKEERDA